MVVPGKSGHLTEVAADRRKKDRRTAVSSDCVAIEMTL
jgi:hypothetical protein